MCSLMFCGSGGSKSRLAKAASAPSDGIGNQKLHADVARSAFGSEHFESTAGSDHFWKLRCQSNARRCGAKQMSKSKRTEHTILGALLEVEMFKKCTLMRREAHFEVKLTKAFHSRCTFGS